MRGKLVRIGAKVPRHARYIRMLDSLCPFLVELLVSKGEMHRFSECIWEIPDYEDYCMQVLS